MSYGIRMMLLAGIVFAGLNVCVKMLPNIPVVEIVFFRAMISFALSLFILKRKRIPIFGNNKKVLLLRGFFGTIALILYFYTVQVLPLASAMVIHYLSPIFTAVIAHFFLKENLTLRQVLYILISFGGIVIMKGFDTRLSWIDLWAGVAAALFSGAAYNCIRKLKFTENSNVIILYFPMIAFPVTGLFLLLTNSWVKPLLWELSLLILIGVLTQIAQYLLTRAYQSEVASKVAAVTNVGVIYALLLGLLLFDEVFDYRAVIGMFLVVAGVLFNILKPIQWIKKYLAKRTT